MGCSTIYCPVRAQDLILFLSISTAPLADKRLFTFPTIISHGRPQSPVHTPPIVTLVGSPSSLFRQRVQTRMHPPHEHRVGCKLSRHSQIFYPGRNAPTCITSISRRKICHQWEPSLLTKEIVRNRDLNDDQVCNHLDHRKAWNFLETPSSISLDAVENSLKRSLLYQ